MMWSFMNPMSGYVKCPACGGSGLDLSFNACSKCAGKGSVPAEKMPESQKQRGANKLDKDPTLLIPQG
jgi:DnaJ-class molecular chaperone